MEKKFDKELIGLFLAGAEDMLQLWEEASLEMTSSQTPEAFEKLFRAAHNLKGGAGLVGLEAYVHYIHSVEDFLERSKASLGSWDDKTLHTVLKVASHLRSWNESVKTDPQAVPVEKLEFSAEPRATKPAPEAPVLRKTVETAAQIRTENTLRISTAKLDNIIKLMGELSLYQTLLFSSIEKKYKEDLELLTAADSAAKLTEELHAEAVSLRMIPLIGLFRQLERLTRDLSFELGKPLDFHSSGDDVALDKQIIEGISDPLVHIIRNSLDHGLEDIEEREQLGKPVRGQIFITATNEAHGATICIKDDGRGINREKVVKKALSLGLIDEARVESMTEEDQINLILLPGFSTAELVTDLSGRGVGMDVLKNSVVKLGGNLKIQSEFGQGTTIRLQLPSNLSILDALVVQYGSVQLAIPNQDLDEIINLRDYQIEGSGSGEQMINFRGSAVPIRTLDFLEDDTPRRIDTEKSQLPCLVVQAENGKLAYVIDSIIGQQKVFVRPLNHNLDSIPYISGTTILSDGSPTMILNMNELIRDALT